MATLKAVVDGFVAARAYDNATLGRLAFWVDQLGDREIADITPDEVDTALVRLAERGRLKAGRNTKTRRTGQPLSPATTNRYIGQLGSVYRYAKRLRLLPRTFVSPTVGIEKEPEVTHHDRYFRPEEVERLLAVAPLVDRRWKRMQALILLAYHTGLRKQNLLDLRWRDVDLAARTVTVARTKNGRPQVSPLTERAAAALSRLPGRHDADDLIFPGRNGKPHTIRRLWEQVCAESGVEGRTFHALRHGYGSALALAGVNQATVMALMGHRTLTASARYMHHSVSDKQRVVDEVFA